MKLACLRCKRKKIKCDKAEPICHQCVTAKTECQYVERRQRPRLVQQRIAAASLNQRLELLEKQISSVGARVDLAPQRSLSPSTSLTTSTPGIVDQEPATNPAPAAGLQAPDSDEHSWIYQMATDTKRQFQSQATPISTPRPQIDTDMSALTDALEDLGRLRLRADLSQGKVTLTITPEEATQCVEAFFAMMDTLVAPGVYTTILDLSLLRSLPHIIGSPYINIDAGIHVMYFAAVHYGLTQLRGPGNLLAHTAYLKALEHVPAWLEAPIETDMDGYTAAICSWVAVNNLDYQLSWRFHLKACHFMKSKKIDLLDVSPATTFEEEQKREPARYLFWQVLATDCLFRLFWCKPTVIRWNSKKVRPPSVVSPWNLHPEPTQAILICIWISYTARTVEQINLIDEASTRGLSVSHDVDVCCRKLEATIVEWKMEAIMNDKTVKFLLRCVVADHIMNIYAVIVGLKRLANRIDKIDIVDAKTIRAARKIVDILLDVDQDGPINRARPAPENYFIHFLNFYPFCAVFTLYEYVMACTDPNDCEEDVYQLERLGDAMEKSSKTDLQPFTKTIKALNKVSRTIQDSRRRRPGSPVGQPGGSSGTQQQSNNVNSNGALPDLDPLAFDTIPDFPMTLDGDPDPLGFVRAMENDFIGRNWNDNWWDMGGGMSSDVDNGVDGGMNYMPGSVGPEQQAYSMPTPNT
ncbi:fungal specific transcription factor [Stagonosporopsis vannaccii]|nr:fungal specific transcription factor [Stagonosporopsis vannaccii]